MNILLVTTYFYPQNRIPVLRVGQWAKYWALQGHHVTVLTTLKYPFLGPYGLQPALPDGVEVVEVPYLPRWLHRSPATGHPGTAPRQPANASLLRRQLRKWRSYIGSLCDVHDLWIRPAQRRGLELMAHRRYDAIVSSFSPPAVHVVASRLKAAHPEAVWLADFRDLWANNHITSARGVLRRIEDALERRSLTGRADLLATVSQPLADVLQARYPDMSVVVLENGFDPQEFPDWSERLRTPPEVGDTLRICYTGTLYPGRRDPTPLLDALNRLIDAGRLDAQRVAVDFYGQNEKELATILAQHDGNRHGIVRAHGFVSRDEALAAQARSSLLLLLESAEPEARGVMTGKLFEYLVSGKPILGVGLDEDSVAAALIRDTGTGFCSRNPHEIAAVLAQALETGRFGFYAPVAERIAPYARDRQAEAITHRLSGAKEQRSCS